MGEPSRARTAWTVAHLVFASAFAFAVVVQVNDPDPFGWITIYGLAATACVLAAFGRGHAAFPGVIAVAALVWAAFLVPRVMGRVEFLSMFGAFEMESVAVEESREMYGLLLVAAWMAVIAVRRRA